MQPNKYIHKLLLILLAYLLISFASSVQAQSEIGGYVYDYNLNLIDAGSDNTYVITNNDDFKENCTHCLHTLIQRDILFKL